VRNAKTGGMEMPLRLKIAKNANATKKVPYRVII
jgi:hypothetical protein